MNYSVGDLIKFTEFNGLIIRLCIITKVLEKTICYKTLQCYFKNKKELELITGNAPFYTQSSFFYKKRKESVEFILKIGEINK